MRSIPSSFDPRRTNMEHQQAFQQPQQLCFLQKLPPELRTYIYEQAVADGRGVDLNVLLSPRKTAARNRTYPPITRVRGSIGEESRSVFYASFIFAISVCWSAKAAEYGPIKGNGPLCCNGIQGLRRISSRIGRWSCELMSTVVVYWDLGQARPTELRTM